MTPVDLVLSKLPDAKRNGTGWSARCPAHDDKRASLSIGEGDDRRALLKCHAGCTAEQVVAALGLSMKDLMPRHSDTVPRRSATRTAPQPTFATAREAIEALEKQLGSRAGMWTYHDADGEPCGVVVRWDKPDGTKDIRPISRRGGSWIIGAMPKPRPLYRLPDLRDADPATTVYVVEGEKTCDAAMSLGLLATTSAGGSQAAKQTDWTPLAGRNVVILPDHDGPGQAYADDVVELLGKLNPPATVKIVQLPGLVEHEDIVDWLPQFHGDTTVALAALQQLTEQAEVIELDRPDPPLEWRPFPTDALPEPIKFFVVQGSRAIGCDESYVALPLLAGLASAIGNTRRIQLRRTWSEPAIVWAVIVGESGTLKSPALELALRPIRERQRRAMKEHATARERYEADVLQYEKALAEWKRTKTSYGESPTKPEEPIAERCLCDDTTIEALAMLLKNQPRGLLLARDELSGWLSFDRYSQTKGGDVAKYLECHGGRSLTVDRRSSGTIYIPRAALSITGGIQPAVVRRALGFEHFQNGLAARILWAMPPRRPKRWSESDLPERIEQAVEDIFGRLYELQPDRDDDSDPRPRFVRLSPSGKAAWIQFFTEHAQEQVELSGDEAAAWSKLEGYAARLALVIHCVRVAAGDSTLEAPDLVDEASMGAGITLSRWFGHEARRLYAHFGEDEADRDRRELEGWIRGRGDVVTPRDLAHGLRRFRNKTNKAHEALEALIKAGLGRWVSQTAGGRPSLRFELVKPVTESPVREGVTGVTVTETPADDAENKAFGDGDSGDGVADGGFGDGCPTDEALPPLTEAEAESAVAGEVEAIDL